VILTNLQNESPTIALKCEGHLLALAEFLDMDSHRPEGAAWLAALCFVCLLLTKYPKGPRTGTAPTLRIVLNNKSVAKDDLRWTFGNGTSVFDYLKSDYNLFQGILQELETSPIVTSIQWVKGHQDRHKPWEELSLDA
jgi:hypothetical protein